MPWGLPTHGLTLTWRTTPTTGRLRVCPGWGAGHWSISLHTVDTGSPRQEPALRGSCLLKPLDLQPDDATSGLA